MLLFVELAHAGSGRVDVLPTNPRRARHGVQLRIDSRWVNGNGYRPIRLELSTIPPLASPAERRFRVELFHSEMWRGRERRVMEVVDELVLGEGQASVEKTVLLPQWNVIPVLELRVYEDGAELKEFTERLAGTGQYGNDWTEASPTIVVVSSAAPPYRQRRMLSSMMANSPGTYTLPQVIALSFLLPGSTAYRSSNAQSAPSSDDSQLRDIAQIPRLEVIAPQDLPERWIGLTAVDLLFISWSDLDALAARNAPSWEALRRWTAAGNTLCVFGMAGDAQRRDRLARYFEMPAGAAGQPNWQDPKPVDYGVGFRDAENLLRNQINTSVINGMGSSGTFPIQTPVPVAIDGNSASMQPNVQLNGQPNPPPPSAAAFRILPCQLGRVVALDAEDPFADRSQLEWMLNSLDPDQWAWFQRHGLSLNRGNQDFTDWLIPGVGDPPVVLFLVLLSGFVILIGPVNYFSLRRRKRLYLLLVTVPLAAFVTTAVLLVFGILSDGFGVRVRSRSYTSLDQATGEQVTWSRQSYYAGLQPAGGLVFDDNTLVLPIDPLPKSYYDRTPPQYRRNWTRSQALSSGYLRARETAQFLIVQAGPQPARLAVERRGAELEARNELGGSLRLLVARDATGQWFMAETVAAGAASVLKPVSAAVAQKKLQAALPQRELSSTAYVNYWSNVDQEITAAAMSTSVLEKNLERLTRGALEPGAFVGVTTNAEWLPRGVQTVQSVASVHAIEGRWDVTQDVSAAQ